MKIASLKLKTNKMLRPWFAVLHARLGGQDGLLRLKLFLFGFLAASTLVGTVLGSILIVECHRNNQKLETIKLELESFGRQVESRAYSEIPSEIMTELSSSNEFAPSFPAFGEAQVDSPAEFDSIIESIQKIKTQLSTKDEVAARIPTLPPVNGFVSSKFGLRHSPVGSKWEQHWGVDIAARVGSLIASSAPGTVKQVTSGNGYGTYLIIDHGNGVESRYAHNGKIVVRSGDFVQRGQIIGTVGLTGRTTGPHLHFEVWVDGHPVDPTRYVNDLHMAPEKPTSHADRKKSNFVKEASSS